MTQTSTPTEYQLSCSEHHEYPLNLIPDVAKSYQWTLEGYKRRFDSMEKRLCLTYEKDVEVPIRDVYFDVHKGNVVEKCNIHTAARLNEWLGIGEAASNVSNARYPQCRFIYTYAEHSRDRLRLTHAMLTRILTHHQVMPEYLDFIFVFGTQDDPRDLRFSGFCQQTMLEDIPSIPVMPGRSWRQYQLCYNLKGVSLVHSNREDMTANVWSVRQAAIYHQFDVVHGTMLWIVTKGNLDLQQRFKQLTSERAPRESNSFGSAQECFRSSLAAHLMYCRWSTEDWRWYIGWLESVIDKETAMAIYGRKSPGLVHNKYLPRDIQDLQHWKDKANEATMILESNVDVMTALKAYYVSLNTNERFPLRGECQKSIVLFAADVDKSISWLRTQILRVKLLADIIADRKELVIQHIQSQVTERTEQLNENLEKEAIVMRIITMVTLLYLPATFVSTFFSTDIIKYQSSDGGEPGNGKYSDVAMMRWLQVTLPLTVVTMCTAWVAYTMSAKKKFVQDHTEKQFKVDDVELAHMGKEVR